MGMVGLKQKRPCEMNHRAFSKRKKGLAATYSPGL